MIPDPYAPRAASPRRKRSWVGTPPPGGSAVGPAVGSAGRFRFAIVQMFVVLVGWSVRCWISSSRRECHSRLHSPQSWRGPTVLPRCPVQAVTRRKERRGFAATLRPPVHPDVAGRAVRLTPDAGAVHGCITVGSTATDRGCGITAGRGHPIVTAIPRVGRPCTSRILLLMSSAAAAATSSCSAVSGNHQTAWCRLICSRCSRASSGGRGE